jgi:hypothetical protein
MRRVAVILVVAVAILTSRDEPFVGQWESTGGEGLS